MMDLADYLQAEVDKASIRRVAKHIGISKTTVENIVKRRLKTMPDLSTLEKIASAYDMGTPAVVEMAGMLFSDPDVYLALARELERKPWIAEAWPRLVSLTPAELKESLDYIEWRRRHPGGAPPPPHNDDQSRP